MRAIPSNKYVLGKGELEILRMLKSSSTQEKILDYLLSKRILNAKAACEKAIFSLSEKKIVALEDEKVVLTDAGKQQRDVLLLIGIINEPSGEINE